jgi:phosphoribosylformylglycinamidine synthase PurS subunit
VNQVFSVEVVISNKPKARDPEGETIERDLIHKQRFQSVKQVRSGKLLTIQVEASSEDEAKNKIQLMCDDLRLYNPVAHLVDIRVRG